MLWIISNYLYCLSLRTYPEAIPRAIERAPKHKKAPRIHTGGFFVFKKCLFVDARHFELSAAVTLVLLLGFSVANYWLRFAIASGRNSLFSNAF